MIRLDNKPPGCKARFEAAFERFCPDPFMEKLGRDALAELSPLLAYDDDIAVSVFVCPVADIESIMALGTGQKARIRTDIFCRANIHDRRSRRQTNQTGQLRGDDFGI